MSNDSNNSTSAAWKILSEEPAPASPLDTQEPVTKKVRIAASPRAIKFDLSITRDCDPQDVIPHAAGILALFMDTRYKDVPIDLSIKGVSGSKIVIAITSVTPDVFKNLAAVLKEEAKWCNTKGPKIMDEHLVANVLMAGALLDTAVEELEDCYSLLTQKIH